MAWQAVLAVARSQLARSWRTLVALGLLAGVVGAAVTGAVGVALRTATAHERLETATGIDDARVLLLTDGIAPEDVLALPQVRSGWVTSAAVGQVVGDAVSYASLSTGPPPPPGLFTPVVLAGRPPLPDADDEVLLSEVMAEATGLGVGATLELDLLTPEEVRSFDVGFGAPDGERARLRITGIARMPSWGSGLAHLVAGPAFAERHAAALAGTTLLLRLEPGVDPAALAADLDRLAATAPVPDGAEEFGPYALDFPATKDDGLVEATERVLVGGLGAFAAVAALAGVLAVLQGFARHHASGASEQRVEAALGMTGGERVLARVLPAGLAAVTAAAVTAGGALAAAWLEPLGALRRFEPQPGWASDPWLVVDGAGTVVLVVLALAAVTAAWAGGTGTSLRRDVPRARPLARLAPGAAVLAGAAFALDAGRGRGAAPVRATIAGAVLGVAGVVAAVVFAASLDRVAGDPSRYGWSAHLAVIDAKDPDVARIAADPRVRGVAVLEEGAVRLAGAPVPAVAVARTEGDLPWTVLAGRMPTADDEVALGPRLLEQEGLALGSTVTVASPTGGERELRVIGEVLAPVLGQERLGGTAVLAPGALADLVSAQPLRSALVRAADEATGEALTAELSRELELQPAAPPQEVRDLLGLGRLPHLLAVFLATLAATVIVHALTVTTRRRARDIAVLRALGFTTRQVGTSLVAMSALTALVGLGLGLPLGVAAGRVVWAEVATGSALAGDARVPVGLLLGIAVVTLLLSAALAVVPALRAARLRPGPLLRSEAAPPVVLRPPVALRRTDWLRRPARAAAAAPAGAPPS